MYDIGTSVVGAGFMGPVHVEALRRLGVRVTGILGCDDNESQQAEAALGLPKAYGSFDEVLADDAVDAVHLAVPNVLHYEMSKKALQAGKNVMCEKPLVTHSCSDNSISDPPAAVERFNLCTSFVYLIGAQGACHTQFPDQRAFENASLCRPLGGKEREDIFISYSHRDQSWADRLRVMLAPAERDRQITIWSDQQIRAGQYWREKIDLALDSARVGVLLVSPNFLASKFIMEDEFPHLMKASKEREVKLLWVLVSSCLYETILLHEIQAVRDLDRPLDTFRGNLNKVLAEICHTILDAASSNT